MSCAVLQLTAYCKQMIHNKTRLPHCIDQSDISKVKGKDSGNRNNGGEMGNSCGKVKKWTLQSTLPPGL